MSSCGQLYSDGASPSQTSPFTHDLDFFRIFLELVELYRPRSVILSRCVMFIILSE